MLDFILGCGPPGYIINIVGFFGEDIGLILDALSVKKLDFFVCLFIEPYKGVVLSARRTKNLKK